MINWKILGKRSTYNILIKLKSASYRETNMVKRRTEVISKCKIKKFLFACYHSKGKACFTVLAHLPGDCCKASMKL